MIIVIYASLCPTPQRKPDNIMEGKNQTAISEFIILGFSDLNELQFLLFIIFFLTYICTLGGNIFIILVTMADPHLHTPMYYFLRNLAFLDVCYTTTNVPQMMVHLVSEKKSISFGGCVAQLFAFIFFVGSECLLLAAMAYDRYTAICKPLRYSVIMNKALYNQLAASCWTGGFLNSVVHTVLTFRLPFCGNNQINYFFCDIPPLLILSCGDTSVNELVLLSIGVFIGWTPLLCIVLSYLYIISTILRIHSSEGRHKAFSTCASHLVIVLLYYGSAIFTYVRPISSYSLEKDRLISVLYSVVTPMLNPIIYTLRNKDIKEAMKTIRRRWQPQSLDM
ncbi:olfactory receptor 5V1-like [Ictidomys tridecemlineatus]|uniref:olfactory receptor 5V1-like n=1 Tax=Ictidomys tridecemlineatus TaxID=43179 RepID=UPI00038BFE1E|nr:olfactory receptor 5V1-like [Ictidomys tridecemlineatus]KAG3288906.1 olfactory receptor 5V1-like [Ictidomys tridecemlineatus]